MEIYDFANLILFSPELEAKLFDLGSITDQKAHQPLELIPARPARLFEPTGLDTTNFPTDAQLRDPLQRGVALHSFVNHELLALELMALMLLRFPEAPTKFRQSLVATMIDEQAHCRLYLERMRCLGVEFGSVSQNFYFWNELHKVESIYEFVAGMSLCFEQANLDFSLYFRRQFELLNDSETAEIMRKVYEDEVNHVRTGLAWFRKWKEPDQTDWQAFVKCLPGNLSPIRGKGRIFDSHSRQLAGFDPNFTDEMSVYSRSRGRRPSLFIFFPNSDAELNDLSPSASSGTLISQLREDLETCLHPIAGESNCVLVSKMPSIQYRLQLKAAGFAVPDFVTEEELLHSTKSWSPKGITPWAVCPSTIAMARTLHSTIDESWTIQDLNIHQRVNSKAFASELDNKPDKQYSNHVCTKHDDAFEVAKGLLECNPEIVVKSNHASSGQGNRVVRQTLDPSSVSWMNNLLHQQGCVIIEPWLRKLMDFSIHARIQPDGKCTFSGVTPFLTTPRGQYAGSIVGPKSLAVVTKQLRTIDSRFDPKALVSALELSALNSSEKMFQSGYYGPFSQDALIYSDQKELGEIKLRELVEINARFSMGRVALEAGKHVHPSSIGMLYLVNPRAIELAGCKSPLNFAEDYTARSAFKVSSDRGNHKLIERGALWLTDPYTSKDFMIMLLVGDDLSQLRSIYPEACRLFPEWLLSTG
jgi:uncharacterized ferritin-like protein (DUF455 family)